MSFQKGHKFGKGRPPGSGKRQSVSAEFQAYLAGEVDGQTRFNILMERVFVDDPKTFLAYAFGKPIETQVHQNPDGSNLFTQAVIEGARELFKMKAS